MKALKKPVTFFLIFLSLFSTFTFLQFDFATPVHASTINSVFGATIYDGSVRGYSTVYSTAYTATTSDVNTTYDATTHVGQLKAGSYYYLYRTMIPFDTSNVPDTATITSVILSFNITNAHLTTANFTTNIYTPNSNNSYPHVDLLLGDYWYQYWASPSNMTKVGDWGTGNWTGNNLYYNVTLSNSAVNVTGDTRLCLRSSREEAQTVPTSTGERFFIATNASGAVYVSQLHVTYSLPTSSVPPVIQDFYVNATWAANATMWSFNVTDNGELQTCTFAENATSPYGTTFTNHTMNLMGNSTAWANFTVTLPSSNCYVGFNFWVWNTNSSLSPASLGSANDSRIIKVYTYNDTAGAWNTPFNTLGDALVAIEEANDWGSTENYAKVLLDQADFTSLQTMIDTYATTPYTGDSVYGSTASGTSWSNPNYSCDNSTGSSAGYIWSVPNGWTDWLTINLSTTAEGHQIWYWVRRNATTVIKMEVEIANQTGSWYNVFSSYPTWNINISLPITPLSQYTAMRYRFKHPSDSMSQFVYVAETTAVNTTTYTCDALNTLKWCAITEKLNMTWANKQNDINWALGNASMVGYLPFISYDGYGDQAFSTQSKFALYGFYYANQSWALSYNPSITAKWNITAAYLQYNASVYYSMTHKSIFNDMYGMPIYIYIDNTGATYSNRFYDEDACTLACYLIFYSLLNVSDGLTQALNMWTYTVSGYSSYFTGHWDETYQYFKYKSTEGYPSYECESAFFLKIISILRYYAHLWRTTRMFCRTLETGS